MTSEQELSILHHLRFVLFEEVLSINDKFDYKSFREELNAPVSKEVSD
jgi:hypothetical protein